jgi:hypothetical protein
MSQEAENALLNVEDNRITLWNMANEATDHVNTNEMIDFLVLKGKNPPLPLKKSGFLSFLSWYAPPRYDPDQKYNMKQYNQVYVERAKMAWKLYKNYQDQIQWHNREEDWASRAEIDKARYNETKNNTKNEKYLRSAIESLNDETDRNDMMNKLRENKNQEKKTGLLSMFGVPSFFRKNGGKSKRVKRVKRSRRVKRSTKRRKH